jgi:hypothetical protein
MEGERDHFADPDTVARTSKMILTERVYRLFPGFSWLRICRIVGHLYTQ